MLCSLKSVRYPFVREELEHCFDNHQYLQEAFDTLDDEIPVATISDTVTNREVIVAGHLDPGGGQAFTLADAHIAVVVNWESDRGEKKI